MYFNKNHEEKVKKNGRYIYIGSYKKGEISKDKRNIGIIKRIISLLMKSHLKLQINIGLNVKNVENLLKEVY